MNALWTMRHVDLYQAFADDSPMPVYRWKRLGLAGGAIWSALLFPLLWPYTQTMGPYALLLAWLARRDDEVGLV